MKKGDKVICIDTSQHHLSLTYGKEYIVEKSFESGAIMVTNNLGWLTLYRDLSPFCSLKEYRKIKLKKIENEI